MDDKFEEFDHCGDVGVDAWGSTTERVLENATLGLFSLMVIGAVSALVERELFVEADTDEDLLVDWLSEVITAASTHGEVYCEVSARQTGPNSIQGVVRGEPIDAGRHELRFDVKAATYHQLTFERKGDGFHARVIFDL